MMYYGAFDVSDLVLGSITLSTSGKPNAVVSLTAVVADDGEGDSSSVFFHYQPSGFDEFAILSQDELHTPRLTWYATFSYPYALQTAIRTAITAQGWTSPSSFTVSFNRATGIYTFSYSAAFGYVVSAAGGAFLGFTTLNTSASPATSHTGNAVANYAIRPNLPATSLSSPNFEPIGIAARATADTGDGFGVSREIAPTYRDWVQQYELKAKTQRRSAASTHPWTFQALFEHCRTKYAFIVFDGFGVSEAEVFSFRDDGSTWKPERASPGNDVHFHIPFKVAVEGTVESYLWG